MIDNLPCRSEKRDIFRGHSNGESVGLGHLDPPIAEPSRLRPFVRSNLDILFVGLNAAAGSSRNGHYFSVNQAFWDQLHAAGLIASHVDKLIADEIVFGGGANINFKNWSYGITDLVTDVAGSCSAKIKPARRDCELLRYTISDCSPRVAVLLHGKLLKRFLTFLGHPVPPANFGELGRLIPSCSTVFFSIAFPHGNAILSENKVAQYQAVKRYLTT
ncbi:MAG: hypothetical protein M1358_17435 [Chloroflexi bacterium]|nr:hypothetical protein [Chloroflexota bacterium]